MTRLDLLDFTTVTWDVFETCTCATSLCVCPLIPSTIPLIAVCYSCWSNLENVPNPLSVLPPQRNTKWIRRDYRLPLPPPRPPLPPLLPLPRAVTLSSSPHVPYLSTCCVCLSPDTSLFIGRIKTFSIFRCQLVPMSPLVTDALTGPVHYGTWSIIN